MSVMIWGLVLFLGIHLVPMAPALRLKMTAALGARAYRGLFAAIAALGLILIIAGYHTQPDRVQLFAPSPSARQLAPLLVGIAFVLLAAANMKTHIRKALQHPMLIGLMLWSGVHLLANGDLAGTILFASFFAYSLLALASAIHRRVLKVFVASWKYDVMAIAGGVIAACLTILFHSAAFGTPPVV